MKTVAAMVAHACAALWLCGIAQANTAELIASEASDIRAELGARGNGPDAGDFQSDSVNLEFSADGTFSSLSILAKKGGIPVPCDDPAETVRFLFQTRPRLFGFDSRKTAEESLDGGSVYLSSASFAPTPDGLDSGVIHLASRIGGIDSDAGGVSIGFVNGRLISIFGQFDELILQGRAEFGDLEKVGLDVADLFSAIAVSRGMVPSTDQIQSHLQFNSRHRRPVWRVTGPAKGDAGDIRTLAFSADAVDGTVLWVDDDADQHASGSGLFRHYQPSSVTSIATVFADSSSEVYLPSPSTVYSWSNGRAGRSPLYSYNGAVNWSGVLGFDWHSSSNLDFLHVPGDYFFQSQHAYRWIRRAWDTADINYTWFSPPAAHKWWGATVLSNMTCPPENNRPNTGDSGCWGIPLWGGTDHGVGLPCMKFCNSGWWVYGDGSAPLSVLFHEAGHAVEWKYLDGHSRSGTWEPGMPVCRFDTTDEGKSLGEAIAMLYSMTMFAQDFGGYSWTQYRLAGNSGDFTSDLLYRNLTGPIWIHNGIGGNSTAKCHGYTEDCNSKYDYAQPLIQAYWEAVRGMDCHNPSCVALNDGAGSDEARWAFFYALQMSNDSTTYRQFVGQFLNYYNLHVGYTQWANRWWIFHHHNLVGSLMPSADQCE